MIEYKVIKMILSLNSANSKIMIDSVLISSLAFATTYLFGKCGVRGRNEHKNDEELHGSSESCMSCDAIHQPDHPFIVKLWRAQCTPASVAPPPPLAQIAHQ